MYLSSFCYGFVFKMAEIRAGTGNTFGTLFHVTTFGESDGGGVGCVIDGCPPRIPLSEVELLFGSQDHNFSSIYSLHTQ